MGMLGREMRKVLTPEGIARVLIDEHVTSRASDVAPSARSPLVACLNTIQWIASNVRSDPPLPLAWLAALIPLMPRMITPGCSRALPLHVRARVTDSTRHASTP